MIGRTFRPWGPLSWVLSKLATTEWSVLGCLGPEERCLVAWDVLIRRSHVHSGLFVEVKDPPSRFTIQTEKALAKRRATLRAMGVPSWGTKELDLFSRDADIVGAIDEFLAVAGPSVLLDITSFPKRVFFPFIRRLLQSNAVENVLVTYSIPASYGEVLAEDHQALQHLPLFGPNTFPEPSVDVAFVGVGFSPLGLPELLEPYKHEVDVRLLFPFPPGPPAFQRNWTFVGELKKRLPPNVRDPIRVGAYDLPDAFEHICQATERGAKYAVFAPYGPKPVSTAMCLYAIASGATVYYTQPTSYNPEYSLGVKMIGGEPEIYGYCLRIGGRDLYAI